MDATQKRWRDARLPLLIGASLHWASVLLAMVPLEVDTCGLGSPDWQCTALGVLICLGATLCSGLFGKSVTRAIIALLGCGASLIDGTMTLYVASSAASAPVLLSIAHQALLAVSMCSLVLLWGLAFAALDKRSAGINVLLTSALSVSLLLLLIPLELVLPFPDSVLENLMRIASGAIFLVQSSGIKPKVRPLAAGMAPRFERFLFVRFLVGVAVGCAGSSVVMSEFSVVACLIMVVPLVIGGALAARAGQGAFRILPVVPLLSAAALVAPFAASWPWASLVATPMLCWLCWIETSSFQISGLKEIFGLGEARLCFAEKSVLLLGWLVGIVLVQVVGLGVYGPAGIAMAYAVVLWATISSLDTVYSRREDEIVLHVEAERVERRRQALSCVTERYGLTERESEVLALLVQDVPRAQVRETLGISDGTARAHISHIYQKLGIHKREHLNPIIQDIEEHLNTE